MVVFRTEAPRALYFFFLGPASFIAFWYAGLASMS